MGFPNTYNVLAKYIAGDIVLSPLAGTKIKQWRQFFTISQKELADAIDITASVISDYESGRRKRPGTEVVQNIVSTLITLDEKKDLSLVKEILPIFPFQRGKLESAPTRKLLKESVGVSLLIQQSNGKVVGSEGGTVSNLLVIDVPSTSYTSYLHEVSKYEQTMVIFVGGTAKERLCFHLLGIGHPYISCIYIPSQIPATELEKRILKVLSLSFITTDFQTADDLISRLTFTTNEPYI